MANKALEFTSLDAPKLNADVECPISPMGHGSGCLKLAELTRTQRRKVGGSLAVANGRLLAQPGLTENSYT